MDEKTKKMIDPDEIDEMEEEQVPESEAEELEETAFTEESEVVDLPMIPLRGLSIFPNMVLHFDIGREKSINALEKAMIMDQHIFLASRKMMKRIFRHRMIFIISGPSVKSSRCSSCRGIPFAYW